MVGGLYPCLCVSCALYGVMAWVPVGPTRSTSPFHHHSNTGSVKKTFAGAFYERQLCRKTKKSETRGSGRLLGTRSEAGPGKLRILACVFYRQRKRLLQRQLLALRPHRLECCRVELLGHFQGLPEYHDVTLALVTDVDAALAEQRYSCH